MKQLRVGSSLAAMQTSGNHIQMICDKTGGGRHLCNETGFVFFS